MPELDPLLRPDFSPLFSFDAQISEKHESNRFHVLQSGDDFWLRLEGHPDWLGVFDNPNGQLSAIARSGDWDHFEFSLRRAAQLRFWGRVLSLFDANEKLWRVAWMGQKTFLMRPDTGEAAFFRSGDKWKRGAWIQPGAHFLRRFEGEWNTRNSDVRWAKAFLEVDDEARRLWDLEWTRGSWNELKTVLRAATIVEHEFGERVVRQSRVFYLHERRHAPFGSNAPQSGQLLRLIKRVEERNVAILRDQARLRQLASRPFAFESSPPKAPELRVEVDAPSEHERLEARLELRTWLRENAPDLLGDWTQ